MFCEEDTDRPYTARSIKATGLLDETKTLLRAWRPGETTAKLRQRAREEGLLGKATASRTEDVVAHAFNQRFLSGPSPVAQHLQRLLEAIGSGRWFTQICLLYAARADVVLHEAVTVYLTRRQAENRPYVDTQSFVRFLDEQESCGRMASPWSNNVKEGVAQHIMRQLTDFGLAGPPRRGARMLLRFEPSDLAVAWLTYDLHLQGLIDADVLDHQDWKLWLMEPFQIRSRLVDLARPELWELQAAGSVVQFTWSCQAMDEVVDVLTRRELL